jgi:FlaA1/EpsC-like NDP-sugar epimerase
MFEHKVVLITGGTGSWGRELTKRLLAFKAKEIRIFSRSEFNQVQMDRDFEHAAGLTYRIGDVRDYGAVLSACEGVDYVFHLAALKHVPICENQPDEALKTNVKGTENVIKASLAQRVKKVIDVSTDKAVNPVNFYGMTKLIGERLMLAANSRSETTRFVCVRGGNVLGTRGSVVPYFQELIAQKKVFPITSVEMTRFLLTVSEAIELLVKAATEAAGGEIFVMKMKACRITELAAAMQEHYAATHLGVKEVGIRTGEKLHEELVSPQESMRAYLFDQQYYVILPENAAPSLLEKYRGLGKAPIGAYSSNDELMGKAEINEMMTKGGFYS